MADSIEHLIREGLAAALAPLTWARKIEPYKIRIGFSEMKEHEVPYIQFYGVSQSFVPDRTQVETRWQLAVDLVMRQGSDGLIDQRDLDDKRQEILEAVGAWMEAKFNGISVIQVVPISATDDLNLFDPFFMTTILFEFLYLKRYVRDC
jgi:hypothetical protein